MKKNSQLDIINRNVELIAASLGIEVGAGLVTHDAHSFARLRIHLDMATESDEFGD